MSKHSLRNFVIVFIILMSGLFVIRNNVSAETFPDIAPPEIPGEAVYVPFPVDITLDGDLSDWQGIPGSQVVDENAIDPAENGSFTFSVAADFEYFYITMQMPDKNIVAGQHGSDFYNEDSFEFYINASGDLNATSYADKIFQININATDIGNTDPDSLTITGVFSTDQVVRGFVFKTEDGWGFEAAVPLEGLATPEHGTEIGFQAQINGATKKDRDVKLIWSNADVLDQSWEHPNLFGRALFFEVGRSDIPEYTPPGAVPTSVPTPTPVIIPVQVSVNQTGYFVEGEKIASIVSSYEQPIYWRLLDSSGKVVLKGQTIIKGEDVASRDDVHIIDFSEFNTPGIGYQIETAQLESAPFDISNEIYSQLKHDALAYFYHNRSGVPIESQYVGEDWARPAGHLTDNSVTCFQGEDADGHSWPGCNYTLDVSGGWYDAGDYGKYVPNGGISVWTLMNLYERFPEAYPDGSLNIPENNNGIPDILDEARWEMEFLLSMQVPEGQPKAGMAHHKIHDRSWAPMPLVPPVQYDNDNEHKFEDTGRYLYAPSTAATLNLAATAAQCARIWQEIDDQFSDQCLAAAEIAWVAALDNPGIYAGNNPGDGGGNYDDDNVADEFFWAAVELYVTTGQEVYQSYLLDSDYFAECDQFDWSETASLGTLSLAVTDNNLPDEQAIKVEENLIRFADDMVTMQGLDGYSVLIEGDYPWGSNGLILNNMILLSIAYDINGDAKYLDAVRLSMDYIMGRNPLNKCYVSGYGEYPMEHPHHRFWAYDPGNGYPPPPPGAIAGGPNSSPTDPAAQSADLMSKAPSKRYADAIESYSTNEVAINWNASLAWVVTFLDETREGGQPEILETEVVQPEITETEAVQPVQQPFSKALVIMILIGLTVVILVLVIWFIRKKK